MQLIIALINKDNKLSNIFKKRNRSITRPVAYPRHLKAQKHKLIIQWINSIFGLISLQKLSRKNIIQKWYYYYNTSESKKQDDLYNKIMN